jgi:phage FluMu protein Com
MPIKIKCKCGKVLAVPDSMAGKKGRCPACKVILSIPAAKGPPKLKLAAGAATATGAPAAPASEKKTCPYCSAILPGDAIICVNCGTNLLTGQKLETKVEE